MRMLIKIAMRYISVWLEWPSIENNPNNKSLQGLRQKGTIIPCWLEYKLVCCYREQDGYY